MIQLPEHKHLVLFDGVCNLCNSSIQYVIKHDKNSLFMFAPLQGETGKKIVEQFDIDTSKVDSILLYTNDGKLFTKSTAALKIAKQLRFPVSLWSVFLIVPTFIRNWVYDIVAKNRYKWFGKQDACMVPTPELKSKFME